MKNLSSKKTMRWAVILIMILTLVFSLASCGPTDTDEDPDTSVTTTNLFANGDFKEFSGTASPFSPTSWSDSVSDTDEDAQAGILSGVINTGEAFLKDRKTWTKGDAKNIANPTTNHANATADPYVLMIYNSISAAKYYYESFTAAAAKYYKVTVDVKVPAGSTAHVRLRGNTLDEIVVDSSVVGVEWNTYTFYIQSHSSNSKSVQLELWNGSSGTGYGATGAVFFDTASATELTADEWADVTGNNTGDTHFVSMKLPNPNFDNSTSVYNESYPAPITPSDYTSTAGTSKDTSKANASGGSKISYGIVRGDYKGNTSLGEIAEPIGDGSDPSFVPPTPFTTVKDFVLMLRNRDYTAYGYKANSTNTIRIERGQFYAISVWVKTVDLLSVAYTPYPSGPYFKNSDGVYTQIYSSFSVAGEYALAIRNNAYPTIDGSTTYAYLDVVGNGGDIKSPTDIYTAIMESLKFAPGNGSDNSLSTTNFAAWLLKEYTAAERATVVAAHLADYLAANPPKTEADLTAEELAAINTISEQEETDLATLVTAESGRLSALAAKTNGFNELLGELLLSLYKKAGATDSELADQKIIWDDLITKAGATDEASVADANAAKTALLTDLRTYLVGIIGNDDFNPNYDSNWTLLLNRYKSYIKVYDKFLEDPTAATLYVSYGKTDYQHFNYIYTTSYKYSELGSHNRYDLTPEDERVIDNGANANRVAAGKDPIGGSIKLASGSYDIEIKGIVTEGEWIQYTFYIEASQFNYTDLTISYNLGEGGAADVDTHVKGIMFVDKLEMEEQSSIGDFVNYTFPTAGPVNAPGVTENLNNYHNGGTYDPENRGLYVTLAMDNTKNLVDNWDFSSGNQDNPDGWSLKQPDEILDSNKTSYIHATDYSAGAISAAGIDLKLPYTINDYTSGNVLAIDTRVPGVFTYFPSNKAGSIGDPTGTFEILKYSYYRFSIWVKTDVPTTSSAGVTVSLVNYKKDKTGEYSRDSNAPTDMYTRTVLDSVSDIKTTDDTLNNGWTEVVFYIGGSYNELKYVDFEITFGSGTYSTTSTLAQGKAYLVYPSMFKITYKEYNSATAGTTGKKYSFTTTYNPAENSITNGEFDLIDMENSKIHEDGYLTTLGVPSSWTFQEGTVSDETVAKDSVLFGKLDLDDSKQLIDLDYNYGTLGLSLSDLTKANIYDGYNLLPQSSASSSLLLMSTIALGGSSPTPDQTHYGLKSSSKSLSANKYYRVSVFARILSGDPNAIIYLSASSKTPSTVYSSEGDNKTQFAVVDSTEWKEYVFYVEVGQNSVSVNLEFWFGTKDKKTTSVGTGSVLFDGARVTEITDFTETVAGGTKDYKASLFFDSIVDYINNIDPITKIGDITDPDLSDYKEIFGKKEFEYTNGSGVGKIPTYYIALSYLTDSFDEYGDDIFTTANEAEENVGYEKHLYSPVGWSSIATLKGDSDDIVAGVLDIDTTRNPYLVDQTITLTDDSTKDIIGVLKGLTIENMRERLFAGMGDTMLIMYNTNLDTSSHYVSNAVTLTSKTVYEISAYVTTVALAQNNNARIYVTIGSIELELLINTVDGNYYTVEDDAFVLCDYNKNAGYDADLKYVKVTFYIDNAMSTDISDVKLNVALGSADAGAYGLVAIDQYTVRKYAKGTEGFDDLLETYKTAYDAENKNYTTKDTKNFFDTAVFFKVDDPTVLELPADPTVDPPPNFQWLIITSAIVGGIVIVIILIFLYQRYKERFLKFVDAKIFKGTLHTKKAPNYDKSRSFASESVKETRQEYDKYRDD